MEEFVLALIGLGVILVLPAMAIAGFVRTGRLRREVQQLVTRVSALEAALAAAPPVAAAASVQHAAASGDTVAVDAIPGDAIKDGAATDAPPAIVEPLAARDASPTDGAPSEPAAPAPPIPPRQSLEERIAARWAVWIGGGTIALAAVFLVRYSIEEGLLGPAARIVLGLVFGFALIAASEWLRRRLVDGPATGMAGRLGVPPANLPPAVASAGVVALYASIYAAFSLYALIGPMPAFLGLAAVSAVAMALALMHGPMVALLGQAAAFAVPALTGDGRGGALPLFAYVLAVSGGCLALARYRGWRWTMWVALGGSIVWLALWFLLNWHAGDAPWIAIFLVSLAALHLAPALGPLPEDSPRREPVLSRDLMPDGPLLAIAVAAFALLRMADYDLSSLIGLAGVFAIGLFAARRMQRLDHLALTHGIVVVLALASWHIPQLVEAALPGERLYPGDVLTPTALRFLGASGGFAVLGLAAGVIALGGALRPWRWAALAVVLPLALFAVGYWRTEDFAASFEWGAGALALAAVYAVLCERIARHREADGMALALGVFAIGVTAAISFCFATLLRAGWLSIALSLQVPILAWIAARLGLRELRWAAGLLGAALIARLVFNPWIVGYELGTTPIFNMLLLVYGVPTLAFAVGAWWFARDGRDWAVAVLEVGAIAFFTILVTAEIRHAQGDGRLDGNVGGLMECALHAGSWLAIALALYAKAPSLGSRVAAVGAWVLGALGVITAVFCSLGVANPLDSTEAVGRFPLFNLLALAYLVPALLFAGFAVVAMRREAPRLVLAAGAGALVFGFVYVNLEVTRAFRGSVLSVARSGDGELYAYSAVWLLYGIALLAAGMRLSLASLRYAALGVVGITILKVFLYDMSTLTGILRVLSFLGLGVSLLGLAWVYQRFILANAAKRAA